jgi:Ca2+-binding RTX toxin-like protein
MQTLRRGALRGRRVEGMRRVVLVLAAMALALLLASGMAWAVNKIGTDGPDRLRGTNRADNLLGEGGNDALFGFRGRDNLLGGPGKDWVLGGNERRTLGGDKNLVGGPGNDGIIAGQGSDNLQGGSGNDFGNGGRGSDRIVGEGGNDYLLDGESFGQEASKDVLSGGEGNDVLDVINRPAAKEVVVCGDGFDRVLADRKDVVAPDCEVVAVGLVAAVELSGRLDERGFFERFFEGLAPFPD